MTNFVNIRLPDNLLLDPQLKLLVDKLAINNPKWVFAQRRENRDTYSRSVAGSRYDIPEEERLKQEAPSGFKFLRAVSVKQDSELLGTVFVDTTYSRRVDQRWQYGVSSWRIDKQRGDMNTTYSAKLDTAIRTVKKTFKPMDHSETYNKAITEIHSGFSDAVRNLMDPIRGLRFIKNAVGLQAYAMAKAMGDPIESPDLLELERQLQSDSYKQSMGEYSLAKTVSHDKDCGHLHPVIAMGDNRYLFKNDMAELVCLDFEQLPERMQNNVSVMHLMQDHEVVRDVGYRYNDTHFCIYV